MRRATGLIHRAPQRAARIYEEHLRAAAAAEPPASGNTRPLLARLKAAAAALNPLAAARRLALQRAQRKTEAATMAATLPAFPNDNALSTAYYEGLMAWLVKTGQVSASAAAEVPPSQYWTNSVAL